MAEIVQEKSKGLKFAEEQLLRHGWEKGKGLGRSENGISEAIKVKIKCGKGGMGHKEGEQFSFHWWDHVFNKASSGLVVESAQNGAVVKKSDDGNDELISNKRPRKAQQAKSMLYGCFVKSATLLSGEERPEKTSDSDDSSSSSDDEDQKLDLSSTTKLSDADLLKACGGRTAHKGARHGLTMSAKLARLEQQEQEFMNKYGKKKHTAETSTSSTDCLNLEGRPDMNEKTKRKKSKRQEEPSENNIHEDKTTTRILSSNDTEDCKPKKRMVFIGASVNSDMIADTEPKKKKKRNRKEKEAPEGCVNGDCSEAFTHTSEERYTHLPVDDRMHKKKKNKKQSKVDETADTDDISEDATDTHNKQPQEDSIEHRQASDSASTKKKKKKKSSAVHYGDVDNSSTAMTGTEDTSNEAQIMDTQIEGQENDRKKKKKKRQSKNQEVVENVQFEESVPKKKKKKSKE
ncbi:G patch domain-containing protein 4-like [Carassius carassius]|uniref:G patch domain-containing protein 4-like n=1 Tax=Carassius carassius TaxID=217509 RepID=UPI0028696714|nr:G patch domain-containing protein 4-like [Carassius carassius]